MNFRLRFPHVRVSGPLLRPGHSPRRIRNPQSGFSLIELLTVIAIIAILAALIFPIAGTVRVRAQESQVIANLESIHASLNIYHLDERAYPPTLGPVQIGTGGAYTTYGGLYPEHLRDSKAYESPATDVQNLNALVPVNPTASQSLGTYDNLSDLVKQHAAADPVLANRQGALFLAGNSMDGSVIGNSYVIHYTRFHTDNQNDPDYKRQLGFRNPPEDTVVTWNDSFVNRDPTSGAPKNGDYLVLFLNGDVKKYSVATVQSRLSALGAGGTEALWRLTE